MTHTFDKSSGIYWSRALILVALILLFGQLPRFLPTTSDPTAFSWAMNVIGAVTLAVVYYSRPKAFTLTIDYQGVSIRDESQKVIYHSELHGVLELGFDKWGHILRFPVGWIFVLERNGLKTRRYGAISGKNFSDELVRQILQTFDQIKAEQAAPSNGG